MHTFDMSVCQCICALRCSGIWQRRAKPPWSLGDRCLPERSRAKPLYRVGEFPPQAEWFVLVKIQEWAWTEHVYDIKVHELPRSMKFRRVGPSSPLRKDSIVSADSNDVLCMAALHNLICWPPVTVGEGYHRKNASFNQCWLTYWS